jgi:hypothetical protein
MKHYASSNLESVVLMRLPNLRSDPDYRLCLEMAEKVLWVLEVEGSAASSVAPIVCNYLFQWKGEEQKLAGQWCSARFTPAEFRSLVKVRVWFKRLAADLQYHHSSQWKRTGDAVIANLNRERVVAFIDAHYWGF